MTPEQQTPASVVERLTYILSLVDDGPALWTHGSPQSTSVSYGDLRAILAHVERLSAEREGLASAMKLASDIFTDMIRNGHVYSGEEPAPFGAYYIGPGALEAIFGNAALTQGESRQTGADHDRGISEEPIGDSRFIYRTTLMGERHVVDAATGFVWFKLPYDYRYTSNAGQRRTAEAIIAALTLPAAPTPAGGGE